jgi:hypothetical protein
VTAHQKLLLQIGVAVLVLAGIAFYLWFDYARANAFCEAVEAGSDAADTLRLARSRSSRVTPGIYKNETRVVFGTCYCALFFEDTKVSWSRVLCHH